MCLTFLRLIPLLFLFGCGGSRTAPGNTARSKNIDRAQRRSLAWQYGRLLTSPAHQTLADNAARNPTHARREAIELAKQTKEVASDVDLYSSIGLPTRAKRRYKTMLAATKQQVASGAINPDEHTRL